MGCGIGDGRIRRGVAGETTAAKLALLAERRIAEVKMGLQSGRISRRKFCN